LTGERRTVRTTQSFFEDLDRQLPAERGPNGEPSAHDFQVFELLRIVEVFATAFDGLPALIPGRADYRILITTGILVPRLAVVGQLVSGNAIELIELDVDINAGDE
jgi:hypothetical protein